MTIDIVQNLTPAEFKAKQSTLIAPPPQKSTGNLTTQQFFELMYWILDIEQPDLVFAPAFPNFLIPGTKAYQQTVDNPVKLFRDTITYKITREEPGSMGGSKQPFGDTRELNPKLRQTAAKTGDTVSDIYGQWFDTLVQFDVWTLTNLEADRLALWFKRFMTRYRAFFREMGLSEIHFWWRGVDEVTNKLRNALHFRTLVFFVRTEELILSEEFALKEIQYKLEKKQQEGG
jgi:hypothetical protein